MKKAIILPVLVSTILAGCGGSDSSSGSAPTTNYTLQFVQLVEEVKGTATSCTLFDVTDQSVGMQTYAKLASDVTVKTYDANGNFNKDLSDLVNSTGVLNITGNDIEDGGYVSVINSPSDTSSLYDVLSIQKELLGDFIIEVDRNQGDVSCYTANKAATLDDGYASVTLNGVAASTFAYDSSQSEITAVAFLSREVSAYKDEDVLVRAYDGTALVDYAFVSTLTAVQNDNATYLSGVTTTAYTWGISLPDNELTGLSVRLNQGNYSYPWLDATFVAATGATTNFAHVDTEANWSYSAEGTTSLNWNFKHNDALSATLDVQLPIELTLTDNDPAINPVASNVVFQAQGIDSTLTRLQRSSYYIDVSDTNGKTHTLNHVIYSEVVSGDDVIIPNLKLTNLDVPEQDATNLTIAVLSADKLTESLRSFFMYENATSDLVSVVLTPADTVKNNKTKNTGSYTLLNR